MTAPRALIAMGDKHRARRVGIRLALHGWDLIATQGTAQALRAEGVAVQDVEDLTGVPVLLGGRAKTLGLSVLGGLLWRRGHAQDDREAEDWGLLRFDLVALDFKVLPSAYTDADDGLPDVEWIDVGGPAVVRAAAKNFRHVAVLTDPSGDALYLDRLDAADGNPEAVPVAVRRRLAVKAFGGMRAYDRAVVDHLNPGETL